MKKNELLKGTAIYTIANLFTKAGSFLLIPITSRLLTPREYGIMGVLTPLVSILSMVLVFGLYVPQKREYTFLKNNKKEMGKYIFTNNLFLLVSSILFYFLLTESFLYKYWNYIFDLNEIGNFVFKLSIFIGIMSSLNLMATSYFEVEKSYKLVGFSSIVRFCISASVSIVLLSVFKLGVKGVMFGNLAGVLFIFLVQYIFYIKKSVPVFEKRYLEESLKMGLPMILTGIMGTILNYSDRIVLSKYIDYEVVGIYSLAYTGGMALEVVINSYISSWTPVFYETISENNKDEALKINLEKFLSVLILIALIGQLFGKEIVGILLPSNYFATTKFLPYIISAMILQGLYQYLVLFIHFNRDTKYIPIVVVISGLINLGVNIFFIPKYGAIIAVWSTIISFLFNVVVYFILIYKRYNFKFNYLKIIILYLLTLNPVLFYLIGKNGFAMFFVKLIYFIIIVFFLLKKYSIQIYNNIRRKKYD